MDEAVTPAQCRAARAMLELSQKELAQLSGVGHRTLQGFESGERPIGEVYLRAMREILEERGIIFTSEPGSTGVKLRKAE